MSEMVFQKKKGEFYSFDDHSEKKRKNFHAPFELKESIIVLASNGK